MNINNLNYRIEKNIHIGYVKNHLTDDDLCSIIEHSLTLLNATPVADFAKEHGKTYNGAKLNKNYRKIKHIKFCINNE